MSVPVRVAVRCRPSGEEDAWEVAGNTLRCPGGDSVAASLAFDHVFGESSSHAAIYDTAIVSTVSNALRGENVCILAYGLPKTGKTHTVFGTAGKTRINPEARGVIARCAHQLLRALEEGAGKEVTRITATFCQVFQDGRVADLFDTKKRNLEVVGSSIDGIPYAVSGLTEEVVTSSQDALRLVEKGYLVRNATGCVREAAKKVGLGAQASHPLQQYRPHCSHALFTYCLERRVGCSSDVMVSRVTVVDLAGRALQELITSSSCSDPGLGNLQQVLTVLAGGEPSSAAALFPQTTLTKLLQGSFTGNSNTLLLATISLGRASESDTHQCLELAESVRNIKTLSKATAIPLSQSALGRCLEEIQSLRSATAEKLQVSVPVETLEVVGGAVKVNGREYDQLSSSTEDLLSKLRSLEGSVLYDGKPGQKVNERCASNL